MALYIFNLLVDYFPNGVDYAQGYRAQMFKNAPCSIRYIFTDLPGRREINFYREVKIDVDQMLSVHQYFTDNHILHLTEKTEDKLEELSRILQYTEVEYRDKSIRLMKNDSVIAEILFDENDREYLYGIHYYHEGKLLRTEFYTNGISYVNYYVTAKSDAGLYAKLVRRSFYNKDGSVAYDQIFEGKRECYLFPDGRLFTKQQFIAEFIKQLNLSEEDIILFDRSAPTDFAQPLFLHGNKARFIAVIHSIHYFEKYEDPYRLYLNYEYYYLFKYSWRLDTIVVSTQGQKEELTEKLKEYKCSVPNIEVIPAGGVDTIRYPNIGRRRGSLLSVSRLDKLKKIEWIIKSVIKAHQVNEEISVDIYGSGDTDYINYLMDIVLAHHAQSYVRFMGQVDVTEVYKNYEVYISASLGETLGLSVMEAIGSGDAVIGLDVKYGNRLFIHEGENGYLVDFDISYVNGDDSQLIDDMAGKIIEIFADEERLKEFHRKSYEISKDFSAEHIEEKWRNLLFKKLTEKENTT